VTSSGSSALPARPTPGAGARGGLTGSGAALLLVLVAGAGAGVDAVTVGHLGWAFFAAFVLGCAWVAWRIRQRDARMAFVAPPLVYAGAVLLASLPRGGDGLASRVLHLVELLGDRAPTLMTGLAVVGLVRLVRRHQG
jgi:hypothetical protein